MGENLRNNSKMRTNQLLPNRKSSLLQRATRPLRSLLLTALLLLAALASAGPRRVLILESDTGGGHASTARALEAAIKAKDPDAIIVRKNIWDFAHLSRFAQNLKNKIWGATLRQFPEVRDKGYRDAMERGRNAKDLKEVKTYHRLFSKPAAYEFITEFKADTVIPVTYSAVEIMRALRQDGLLWNVNVGWIPTDYSEGYWPRVSQFLDKTFLPHPSLQGVFEQLGVAPDQLEVTGIPLNPKVFEPVDRTQVFAEFTTSELGRSIGVALDPSIRTVVISGGPDGAAPFR